MELFHCTQNRKKSIQKIIYSRGLLKCYLHYKKRLLKATDVYWRLSGEPKIVFTLNDSNQECLKPMWSLSIGVLYYGKKIIKIFFTLKMVILRTVLLKIIRRTNVESSTFWSINVLSRHYNSSIRTFNIHESSTNYFYNEKSILDC